MTCCIIQVSILCVSRWAKECSLCCCFKLKSECWVFLIWQTEFYFSLLLKDLEKPSPPQKPLPADPVGRRTRFGHNFTATGVHIPGAGPLPIPIPTVPRPTPSIPLPSRSVTCQESCLCNTWINNIAGIICLLKWQLFVTHTWVSQFYLDKERKEPQC